MALKGSNTVIELEQPAEEIKMPERAQRGKVSPVKKEPDADSILGKRAEPEPVDDPDDSDWKKLRQLAQTNKRAKILE